MNRISTILPSLGVTAGSGPDPEPPAGVCPICRGTGWELLDNAARDCRCKGPVIELRLRRARVPAEWAKLGWHTIPPGASQAEVAALRRASEALQGALEGRRSAVVMSANGRGKTILAVGGLRYAVETLKLSVRYVYVPRWIGEIQATFGSEESAIQLLDAVSDRGSPDVVVLDDLGMESSADKPSEWVQRQIGMAIEGRAGHDKLTIATTNLDWESQRVANGQTVLGIREALGPRTFSRMQRFDEIVIDPGAVRDFRGVRS